MNKLLYIYICLIIIIFIIFIQSIYYKKNKKKVRFNEILETIYLI